MRSRRWFVLAGAALAASSLVTGPAGAASPGAPSTATQTVTLALRPSDGAALGSLATRGSGLAPAVRERARRTVRPAAASRSAARAAARRLGFRIVDETAWTLTVSGPPRTLRRVFGTPRTVAGRRTAALPHLPPELRPYARVALGAEQGGPLLRPRVHNGATVRSVYTAPAVGALGSAVQTVATVQFSGWYPSDLTAYAQSYYGRVPPSGQITAVSVDGANPLAPDGYGGEVEVALDQEVLLGVAPAARQRLYVAPNSTVGFLDAVHRVAADARTAHTVALSISWGACEAAWYGATPALDDAFADVLAAGVTVFAASGDHGTNDCGTGVRSVDFPASSPYVLGVGGTTVPGLTAASSETGWSGSGGGASALYSRPAWQGRLCTGGTQRMVPDIAAVADPGTGYTIFRGTWGTVGGTSLAAPVSAALLTDVLLSAGRTAGLGDLHSAVYRAPTGAFRDVVTGANGEGGAAGYTAGAGYDGVTGLGAARWDLLGHELLDPLAWVRSYHSRTGGWRNLLRCR